VSALRDNPERKKVQERGRNSGRRSKGKPLNLKNRASITGRENKSIESVGRMGVGSAGRKGRNSKRAKEESQKNWLGKTIRRFGKSEKEKTVSPSP